MRNIINGFLLFRYRTEFGFTLQDRHIFVDDVRVRGVGKSTAPVNFPIDEAKEKPIEEKVFYS